MATKRKKKTRAHDASKFHVVDRSTVWISADSYGPADCVTEVPGYRLPARANTKVHWTQVRAQRQLGQRMAKLFPKTLPCTITLTRVSPGKLDSHDGLAMAFKAIVDGIADVLVGKPVTLTSRKTGKATRVVVRGNDSDPRLTWRYDQRRGPYAIEARHEVRAKTSVYDKPVELCGECCGVPNFPYCRTHTPITWAYFNTPLEERTHENHDAMVEEQRAARHEVRG